MKKETHPEYQKDAKINCVCGNSMTVGSTRKEINVEICSACHPFYTGKQKLLDTARRVEKFNKRTESKAGEVVSKTVKKEKQKTLKAAKKAEKDGVKIIRK